MKPAFTAWRRHPSCQPCYLCVAQYMDKAAAAGALPADHLLAYYCELAVCQRGTFDDGGLYLRYVFFRLSPIRLEDYAQPFGTHGKRMAERLPVHSPAVFYVSAHRHTSGQALCHLPTVVPYRFWSASEDLNTTCRGAVKARCPALAFISASTNSATAHIFFSTTPATINQHIPLLSGLVIRQPEPRHILNCA